MIMLGIESSCDETAVALVKDGRELLVNNVVSSMDLQSLYGGVVPELAARTQLEAIIPLIDQTLKELDPDLDKAWQKIDGIGVTYGAGLSGSLLIGVLTARTLAILKKKPLYPINHVMAHVYANFLNKEVPSFPMLALIVSGGHTQLVYFKDHFDYKLLGKTTDDAIGEAFDKVAKILGLPYPGGPSISKAATLGDPKSYQLPISRLSNPYDFSFSGLKTAVLRTSQAAVGADYRLSSTELPDRLTIAQKQDIAASFQYTAIKTIVDKTIKAFEQYQPNSVVIAGGVAANQELRRQLSERLPIPIDYAPINLCTDNAAMVATLAYYHVKQDLPAADPYDLAINPNLKM